MGLAVIEAERRTHGVRPEWRTMTGAECEARKQVL
jgi:hypothetical protein